MSDQARVVNGRLYTLLPVRDPWGRKPATPWAGYRDGFRIGFYRQKQEFWKAVEQLERQSSSDQCAHSVRVEHEQNREAAKIISRFLKACK